MIKPVSRKGREWEINPVPGSRKRINYFEPLLSLDLTTQSAYLNILVGEAGSQYKMPFLVNIFIYIVYNSFNMFDAVSTFYQYVVQVSE